MAWLKEQEWRGNVRELKNSLERAILISSQSILGIQDFGAPASETRTKEADQGENSLSLRDIEQKVILGALEKTQGNRTHAAKILGISIRTLRNKLNEYKQEVVPGEKA
jgi:two-component system response regulator FlrC